jgi:isoquinoline 1-oxidoreductase
MKRREFLEALGGGIAVLLVDENAVDAQQGGRGGGREMPVEVSAWLHIGSDGVVTAFAGKVEMG